MSENIEHKFLFELSSFGSKPEKLNDPKSHFLRVGQKYLILGYSPRPGFYGDYYIIYCKKKDCCYNIITSFGSNTKIAQKIVEYRMELEKETPIRKRKDKELYKMDPPIEFTLGEIKKFGGKNINYREIFF